jgi:hypothetical protein
MGPDICYPSKCMFSEVFGWIGAGGVRCVDQLFGCLLLLINMDLMDAPCARCASLLVKGRLARCEAHSSGS